MANVKLKFVHRVRSKGRTYFYAWRGAGAPRLKSKPGTPEFIRELEEAWKKRGRPDENTLAGLVVEYRESDEYQKLADSTKAQWVKWLDRIRSDFGKLSLKQFERPTIRTEITAWRSKLKATPRTADYAIQVLSRLMSFGVEQGKIASNPCAGLKALYHANRADKVWTDEQLETVLAVASVEMQHAIRFALLTGFRRGDLLKVSWNHVHENYIELHTAKSRGQQTATVPISTELRELLDKIPKRSTTILTNSRKRAWTVDGFSSSWWQTMQEAGLRDEDLHFHDLRGTAATRFYLADLPERAIAEILGWSEERVERIINRYVRKGALIQERIRMLDAQQKKAAG